MQTTTSDAADGERRRTADTTDQIGALVGRVLGGRYRISGLLGRGGMGAVYTAHQRGVDREVAVKVMWPGSRAPGPFRVRFEVEAHATSRLNHPNVVTVHDWGIDGDVHFIVLEKLEGSCLHDLIARRAAPTLAYGVEVLRQVARALAAAHARGIIHRDLKPKNIFVDARTGDPHVKVFDFGIAKLRDGPDVKTAPGMLMGTPGYIAPERLLGREACAATDLYSLGVVAWELLAGRQPFVGGSVMMRHVIEDAPALGSVVSIPARLDAVVSALLAKDPLKRPARADVVADELARCALELEREALIGQLPPMLIGADTEPAELLLAPPG